MNNMRDKDKFPFNLKTQVQKDRWLYPRKLFFLISLIFFLLGMILVFIPTLTLAGAMLFGIGSISLFVFSIYFWIVNLIVMWNAKRHVYFWFSVFIRIVWIVFFFTEFYPFLKGKKTINQLRGKKK